MVTPKNSARANRFQWKFLSFVSPDQHLDSNVVGNHFSIVSP